MKPTYAALFTLALCALVAWLGGYNFDQRGTDVGGYSLASLFLAAMVWVFVWVNME